MPKLSIQPFKPQDQEAVKKLIQNGLGEHWGYIDETLNPDLDDISETYAEATFLVACLNGKIVGTGALVPRSAEVGEIVRMSVTKELRRRGIGRQILERLVQEGKRLGYERLILETTSSWDEVIAFYKDYGFEVTHMEEGEFGEDVYFKLDLSAEE